MLPETKVGQLKKIYVLRDFVAQAIGLPLLQAVRERAASPNLHSLWLTVLVENERALRLYRRHRLRRSVTTLSPSAVRRSISARCEHNDYVRDNTLDAEL